MSLRSLIDDAAYEAGRSEYSSAEMDVLIPWFNRFYKSLIETHRLVYTYTTKDNLVAQASDNPLFSYSYQLPEDVLKVEQVQGLGDEAASNNWGQPHWVQYAGSVYSKTALSSLLVKFLPEVQFTPHTLQEALMYRIAAQMSNFGGREERMAARQMRMFKEKLAAEIRRSTVPKNVGDEMLASYLKKVGQVLSYGGDYLGY